MLTPMWDPLAIAPSLIRVVFQSNFGYLICAQMYNEDIKDPIQATILYFIGNNQVRHRRDC